LVADGRTLVEWTAALSSFPAQQRRFAAVQDELWDIRHTEVILDRKVRFIVGNVVGVSFKKGEDVKQLSNIVDIEGRNSLDLNF
jgi:cobalamin biosynthesis protein CobT